MLPHQITYRVKGRDSLSNKLLRKNNKYASIKEITDIIGLRIVIYFEDDIDKVAEVFKKEFKVDYPNSVDKRQVESDKFGYRSLHYVASLNEARLNLTEYKKYNELKFEIQIRSILQHSWAEIEHDLGYKGESEIPETAKRTFYRVAALLEQADIEFVKLRKEILEHEIHIKEQIKKNNTSIKLDKSAIIAFVKESTTINELEHAIETIACKRGDISEGSIIVDATIDRLSENKIETVKQLDDLLSENRNKILEYVKIDFENHPDPKPQLFTAGGSIIWLLNLIERNAAVKK